MASAPARSGPPRARGRPTLPPRRNPTRTFGGLAPCLDSTLGFTIMASGDHSSNHPPTGATVPTSRRKSLSPGQVLVVSSVMFTFISYWRTAAVVLCDLASTAYYIGGIVESQIGPAAPWFILAVMLFSYAVRSVYIESCSMFVRGGVYRVVREAMGGCLAKLAVSALMFDYILTGPISGVSAGQYIIGLIGRPVARARRSTSDRRRRAGDRRPSPSPDHPLLLPPEHPGHPRVERQGAQDHDRHHRHGGHHDRLVRRDPGHEARTGEAAHGGARPVAGRSAGLAEGRCRGQADPRRDGQPARPARFPRPDLARRARCDRGTSTG